MVSVNVLPEPVINRFGAIEKRFEECNNRLEILSSDSDIVGALYDDFEASGASVLSLDVFDTLLIRNFKCEARRWFEIADEISLQLAPNLSSWDIYVARNLATVLSYRTRDSVEGCREGHIDDILAIQKRMMNIKDLATTSLKRIEIEYEVRNLHRNNVLIRLAELVRAKGNFVIMISDMYLDAEAIGAIVRRIAPEFLDDQIFSSADFVVSKRSGLIFPRLQTLLSREANDFYHIGDSRIGDFVMPRRNGWSGIHLPISKCERSLRKEDLSKFILDHRERGEDASAWAKV